MKKPQGILARWIIELQPFGDFKIQYRLGSTNTNADTLSRLINTETINLMTVDLFPEENISRLQMADTFCRNIIQYLKDNTLPEDPKEAKITIQMADNYTVDNDNTLWYYSKTNNSGKVLVLPETKKEKVLKAYHDHLGVHRTLERIRSRYYWPKMYLKSQIGLPPVQIAPQENSIPQKLKHQFKCT